MKFSLIMQAEGEFSSIQDSEELGPPQFHSWKHVDLLPILLDISKHRRILTPASQFNDHHKAKRATKAN